MWRIVVIAALVASSGCGWKEESEKWRRSAEDYKAQLETANTTLDQTRKDLKEQSEKWQTQSQQLGDAMIHASATLDPLEIRKIYLDHRDLAAVARELEAKIAAAVPEDGALTLADAQLRFNVIDYKGRAVIRAYLDNEFAPFFEWELAATEPVLPVTYNIAFKLYDDVYKTNRARAREKSLFVVDEQAKDEMKDEIATKLADAEFSARRGEIDARYKNAVNSEFTGYLKRGSFDTPEGLPKPVFLARQFRTPGRHEIRVRVEPKTTVWEVRLTATEMANGKNEQTIKYWQLNPSTTSDPTNIPRMVFWIRYRPDDHK